MKVLSKFGIGFDRLISSLYVFSEVLIVLLMVGVTVNVVLRYFFNKPLMGTEEVSEYFLLWLTFMGTTWVLKKDKHIRIDVLTSYLKPRTQTVLYTVLSVMSAVVFIFVAWYGGLACVGYIQRDVYLPQVLSPRTGVVWSVVPFGSLLLFIQLVRNAYGTLRKSM